MAVEAWSIDRWKELFEVGGTICALLFTGVALRIDARVRRAETLIEFTKQHRELWIYYDENPSLAKLFEKERDVESRPLSDGEIRFANFLFLHLRAAYGAHKSGILVLPEKVKEDWREIFTHPAIVVAWTKMNSLHDRDFVAFVESLLS